MRWTWVAVLSAMVLAGCGEEAAASGRATETETETAPPVGEPEEEAGPLIRDASFELRATASGPYTAGQAGTFEIRIVPRGEYHFNVDPNFPFSIALGGPAPVSFPESTLDREDSAEFTEQRARFEVPFTASAAGEHRVTATVDFAVCTPSTCLPEQRTLALSLPVQ